MPASFVSSHGRVMPTDQSHSSLVHRKPLGNPPLASNLALAIVLLIVLLLQAVFNAWQDFSTSRVMSSIKNLLPSTVTVVRGSSQVNHNSTKQQTELTDLLFAVTYSSMYPRSNLSPEMWYVLIMA